MNVVDEGVFNEIREGIKKSFGMTIDDMIAVEVSYLAYLCA